jgi:beta-galactosidase
MMLSLWGGANAQAQYRGWVWIEAENTSSANITPAAQGTGRAELVSEGKWLHVSIGNDKVEKDVPDGGVVLSYNFSIARAGQHEVWNRIGFEASRTPFEWRLDGGEWTTVAPEMPTLDLTELALWTDIGWLQLTQRPLTAGAHTLEIRLPKTKNEKNEWRNVNYASDAILITPQTFHPNGRYKPGENFRDARDEQATNNVFQLPAPPATGARASVALRGLWEVARHDDNAPGEVAAPIKEFPAQPHWKAIAVPSDKNKVRPDLIFAHRLWYRTRVNVPQSQVGRSFNIYFPLNNLNTTVYVNGVYCGFNKNPFAAFSIDVTPGIKAGVNEIWVGIRDAYYGFAADPARPQKLRNTFKYPLEWSNKGFMDLDYPVWNSFQSGILNTPVFEVGGPTYVSDIFVKPSVARKQLAVEVTLSNPTRQAMSGELQWQAVNTETGAVEKTFAPQPFNVAAGATSTLNIADGWENPRLWWPDTPNLYNLRTIVSVGGQPVDIKETRFGFREWGLSADKIKYTLNGVVWHLWAEIGLNGGTPDAWLADYRRKNQRTFRYVTAGQASDTAHIWNGLENDRALDFFDAGGVTVRRNTSPLDGEVIGYKFVEDDLETRAKQGGSEIKMALMQNWRDTCVAQVRGERNHPSIQIWTIENEFAYINLINLLGNSPNMDAYEREIAKTSEAVMSVDPTRSVMIDGGGALKENTLPTHGDHYVFNQNNTRYPDLAYEPYPEGGGRGRWMWDQKRPRFIGEDYFATGINPADYAMWGGEGAFLGKDQARPAAGVVYRMLQEGYRWGGHYAAWHFWIGEDTAKDQYGANPWRAVFVRQWDWTFGSGQKVNRTFGIFNDTQYAEPISFTRTLTIGGNRSRPKRVLTMSRRALASSSMRLWPCLLLPRVKKAGCC